MTHQDQGEDQRPPTGTGAAGGTTHLENGAGRTSQPVSRLFEAAVVGYGRSHPAERATFGATSSFAVTIAVSRAINYVRERSRPMPRVRSVSRLLSQLPRSDSVRVHHFLPGIGIVFATAGSALLTRPDGLGRWLSVPFGVGVALTADELPQLAGRNNPYWGKEGFAFAQCAVATLASLGFAADFLRRGRSAPAARTG